MTTTDDVTDQREAILTDDKWTADVQVPALVLDWVERGKRTRRRGERFVQVPIADLLQLLRWAVARTRNTAIRIALADQINALEGEMKP